MTKEARSPKRFVLRSFDHSFVIRASSFLRDGMRRQIGFLLQVAALTLLPMLILWQLDFGIPLIVMPTLTVVGIVVFYVGHRLREG